MEKTGNEIVGVICQCEYTNERNEVIKLQFCNVTSMFEEYYASLVELRQGNPSLLGKATFDALKATCLKCKALAREILDSKLVTYSNLQTLLAWQDVNGNKDHFIK